MKSKMGVCPKSIDRDPSIGLYEHDPKAKAIAGGRQRQVLAEDDDEWPRKTTMIGGGRRRRVG